MKIIVCLDDNGGMTFNNRRQSRDRAVTQDILGMTKGARLLIAPFSEKLFAENGNEVVIDEDFLSVAGVGDYCFVEDRTIGAYSLNAEELVIYRWNRRYPADTYFDVELNKLGLVSVEVSEFEGNSHERITKEIFRR